MLNRTASSRRRRASRSSGTSPQTRSPRSTSVGTSPGRRASIAVSPVDSDRITRNTLAPDINRSPRHSIIPDISFDSRESLSSEDFPCPRSPRLSPRGSIAPDTPLSPRNSLIPDGSRSPRHSLVPGDYSRSPRNSLVPNVSSSPRNSLVPDGPINTRNTLAPENFNRSPRNSLVPDSRSEYEYNRSPRHSLVPDTYPSRLNLPDFNRSPRNSIVPDGGRSPRNIVPSESVTWNQHSPEEILNRSYRHSIAPDFNRSPRGSIAPDRTSPRGSIALDRTSPRGSLTSDYDRSPRGSIAFEYNRSPRGSVVKNMATEELMRSPRGSLTLTFQDPPASHVRRYSADYSEGQQQRGGKSSSPYRSASKGTVNMGYNSNCALSDNGSRRASSSVSQVGLQVSGDEQRRLCEQKKHSGGEQGSGIGISLTTYGSVAYQLKDANLEASNTCDFVCKALSIVNRTVLVTVLLVCLTALPLVMMIMGIHYLRECPCGPNIPVYMIVGGIVGIVKMAWLLWNQLHTRPADPNNSMNATAIGARLASLALTLFLIIWFALGNYWILNIKWPKYTATLFEPNNFCDRSLYVFSLVHLYVVYSAVGAVFILIIVLAGCQLYGCTWLGPSLYK